MLVGRKHFYAHIPWLIACTGLCLASILWYASESRAAGRWPGGSSRVGLVLGIAAAAIIVFEFALWPRKKVRAWRMFGRAQTWMRAHLWLGLLSVPLVVMHTGFQWGGQLSTLLAVLFGIVIVSGVYGLVMQNILPRAMMENLPAETIYGQIDHVAHQFARDAQRKVTMLCGTALDRQTVAPADDDDAGPVVIGAVRNKGSFRGRVLRTEVAPAAIRNTETLRVAFESTIRPFLEQGRKAASVLSRREASQRWFATLRGAVDEAAVATIDELEGLCEQRRQFDTQARMHWWLHGWLLLHLPLSIALVVLLIVHIFVALKYW